MALPKETSKVGRGNGLNGVRKASQVAKKGVAVNKKMASPVYLNHRPKPKRRVARRSVRRGSGRA